MPMWLVQFPNVSPPVNLVFREHINPSTTACSNIISVLITSKDKVDVVHIDFHKMFDSGLHNKLLLKLWNIGITGNLWKWFK